LTRGSTSSTPPRCGGGAGNPLVFFDLALRGADDLERLEEDLCTLAMPRMLTKAHASVNGSKKAVESAQLNSLYRPGACAKISHLRNALLRETRSVLSDGWRGLGSCLPERV
jgi:hypothetical protein